MTGIAVVTGFSRYALADSLQSGRDTRPIWSFYTPEEVIQFGLDQQARGQPEAERHGEQRAGEVQQVR